MNPIEPSAETRIEESTRSRWSRVGIWDIALITFPLCWLFASLACRAGLLFEGMSYTSSLIGASLICFVTFVITRWAFRKTGRKFGWRFALSEALVLSFTVTFLFSWGDQRQQLRIILGTVPEGIHVHQGRSIMFSSFVHFSASPEVITGIIKSRGLELQNTNLDDENVSKYFSTIIWTQQPWRWWQPVKMSNPKIFLKGHPESGQPWVEGLWINGTTNEAYAFISG